MGCVFCEIVAGRSPAHVVAEDEREMAPADGEALMRATQRVAEAVDRAFQPDGINLFHATGEAAGQTVFHVHLHVVPRWFDDRFRPPIVPDRGLDPDLATPAAEIRAALGGQPPAPRRLAGQRNASRRQVI